MNTKHTPGPWKYETQDDTQIVFNKNVVVATLQNTFEQPSQRDVADARLIAAAPELLEFLEELVEQPGQLHEDVVRMKQLIAKATGEEK